MLMPVVMLAIRELEIRRLCFETGLGKIFMKAPISISKIGWWKAPVILARQAV
jgi:hypothetical protein